MILITRAQVFKGPQILVKHRPEATTICVSAPVPIGRAGRREEQMEPRRKAKKVRPTAGSKDEWAEVVSPAKRTVPSYSLASSERIAFCA